jgi:DNA helicase-2/ATP-dependent DNA helicase PcrA
LTRTFSVPEKQAIPKPPASIARHVSNPLNDISNLATSRPGLQHHSTIPIPKPSQLSNFKLRTTPLTTKPPSTNRGTDEIATTTSKPYTFLSSPPPVDPPSSPPEERDTPKAAEQKLDTFQPASTFHTTSVAQAGNKIGGAPRRLGMGRSFKPWSARGSRGN